MTRAANRNSRWMGGSLKRKLAHEQKQNEPHSADTEHAINQPEVPTEKRAQALARSDAIRLRIDAERAAKKQAEADRKAWLAQNDWLWQK